MFRQYFSVESPSTLLEKPGVLSIVGFNTDCLPPDSPGAVPIGLDSLSGHTCEVIELPGKQVERGVSGDCYWSTADDLMCAAVWISPRQCQDIETGAENAYSSLLTCLAQAGYPHPCRIWNFIPNINHGSGDQEAYKKFCGGRLKAFTKHGLLPAAFPAASALGHHTSGAVVCALASKAAGTHYENPLQERAYRYPRQYGPSSPSFSRATGIHLADERWVFLSGTASILGHTTRSPGDLKAQLETTFANINHLCRHIAGKKQTLSALRVYLRYRKDLEAAKAIVSEHCVGSDVIYIVADICRVNLLVEVEAAFAESGS